MNNDQPDNRQPDAMNADAYFEEGLELRMADAFEESIAALTQAIQLSPTTAKYFYHRATTYFIKSDWSEAIADYTEALRLQPNSSDGSVWNFTIEDVYDHRGTAYRYLGDYEAALSDFAKLIRLQPNNSQHYLARSVIYKLKGDFENSLADVGILQRLDPNNGVALSLLADLYRRQGNKAAAMVIYDEQVERFGYSAAYFERGLLWKELGDLPNAIADFEASIRVLPSEHAVALMLADAYLENGDFAKALDILNPIIEHEPGYHYSAFLTRARTHLALGNQEQAHNDLEETIRSNTEAMAEYPPFAPGYALRGHAYAMQGRKEEAIADYKKALELNPAHQDARVMQEYILKNG
jgi:tetratricopeptide (TPR) repeat protein